MFKRIVLIMALAGVLAACATPCPKEKMFAVWGLGENCAVMCLDPSTGTMSIQQQILIWIEEGAIDEGEFWKTEEETRAIFEGRPPAENGIEEEPLPDEPPPCPLAPETAGENKGG